MSDQLEQAEAMRKSLRKAHFDAIERYRNVNERERVAREAAKRSMDDTLACLIAFECGYSCAKILKGEAVIY